MSDDASVAIVGSKRAVKAMDDDACIDDAVSEDNCVVDEEDTPYPETRKYATWHKHVRDLYQINVFIDTTWTTNCAQYMPYMTTAPNQQDYATQTLLTGTCRGDGGQNYIQLLEVTMPITTGGLKDNRLAHDTFELGGYGMGDTDKSGVKVARRMYHEGSVVTCRYMPTNPLIIASSSDDGNCYLFDVSTISLSKAPNEKPRPTVPYPPKKLPIDAEEGQKQRYQRRMNEIKDGQKMMTVWDKTRGKSQHTLTLVGNKGSGVAMDWSVDSDAVLACGSDESVAYWRVGNLSKADARTVEPTCKVMINDLVNDVKFSWFDANLSYIAAGDATLSRHDMRVGNRQVVVGPTPDAVPFTLALSPLNDVAIAVGGEDGVLRIYDQRNFSEAVVELALHHGAVGPISWSPFVEGYIASGGQDGLCTLSDAKTSQLLFKHAAHVETISDIDWSWQEQFQGQLVSCDCNAVSVWKPRNAFWTP